MAKKKKDINVDYNKNIESANISDMCEEYMKIYGANTNIQRHLPDIYDGLKPGERRILYTMYENGARHDRNFVKVATISGAAVGNYHPHGEASVNETITKLAQPWISAHPLIEGSGNFGSFAGDSAGAPRYIEARLSFFAYKCFFEEYDSSIADMKDNYDRTKEEPEVLPAKYPNVLISNTFGIGWGLMTSIPNYNLTEVLELTMKLMDNPQYKNCYLVPDSPTKCNIVDRGTFKEICDTGIGNIKYRGVIDVEEDENCLVIRSTPPQVFWNNLKEKILGLLTDGKSHLLVKLSNDSVENDMCYRIYLKKEVNPYQIRQLIYKKTDMEKVLAVRFKAIENYANYNYNLRLILNTWISYRRETKRRIINNRLVKAMERKHILEILTFILNKDNAEKTLTIMKNSLNKKDIVEKLVKTYKGIMSTLQANEIAELKGYQYSKEYAERYKRELAELDKEITELNAAIRNPKLIDEIIKGELKEGIKLFGRKRQSEIVEDEEEVIIKDTEHILIFTKKGNIKKLPREVDNIGRIADGDYPIEIIETANLKELLIFDEKGTINKFIVSEMNDSALSSEGEPLSRYCPDIKGNIVSIKTKATEEELALIPEDVYLLMLTANGVIKKTPYSSYTNIRSGMTGLVLKPDDSLITAKLLLGDRDIIIYTNKGRGIRFNTNEIRESSRISQGVIGMSFLESGETTIGLDILNENDQFIFAMTTSGTGKLCTLDNFETMKRNSKPLNILPESDIAIIRTVKGGETFKVYTKDDILLLEIANVPVMTRLNKGKKILTPGRGNSIIDIKEA